MNKIALVAVLFCSLLAQGYAATNDVLLNITDITSVTAKLTVQVEGSEANETVVDEVWCLDSAGGSAMACDPALDFGSTPAAPSEVTWSGLLQGKKYIVYINGTKVHPDNIDQNGTAAEEEFCTIPNKPDSVEAVMGSVPKEFSVTVQHTAGVNGGFDVYVLKYDANGGSWTDETKQKIPEGNTVLLYNVSDSGELYRFVVSTTDQCAAGSSADNTTSRIDYMSGLDAPTSALALLYNSDKGDGKMCFYWANTFTTTGSVYVTVKLTQGGIGKGLQAEMVDTAGGGDGIICVEGDGADVTVDPMVEFYISKDHILTPNTGFVKSESLDATLSFTAGAALSVGPTVNCTTEEMDDNCTVEFTVDTTSIPSFASSAYATVNWTVSGGDGGSVKIDLTDTSYCAESSSVYTCMVADSNFNVSAEYTFNFEFCLADAMCLDEMTIGSYGSKSNAQNLVGFGGAGLLAVVFAALFLN